MSSVLRHIAKHSAIYASADILAKVVGFALLPLYTRKFSAAEYGILALILLFNTVPGRFITQGIPHWALKVVTLDYRDDPHRRRVAISTAYYYMMLSAAVVNGLLLLCLPLVARWVLKSSEYNHLLVCAFGISLFQTARVIPLYVLLRANFRSVLYSTLSLCEFVGTVCLNIWFVVFLDSGIAGIIYTDLIVGSCVAVVAFFAGIGMMFLLKWMLPVFKIDVSEYKRKDWLGHGATFFFSWLAFWILLLNPPFADLTSPTIVKVAIDGAIVGCDGTDTNTTGPNVLSVVAGDNVGVTRVTVNGANLTAAGGEWTATVSNGSKDIVAYDAAGHRSGPCTVNVL